MLYTQAAFGKLELHVMFCLMQLAQIFLQLLVRPIVILKKQAAYIIMENV
jgi:hypothetical protein